MNNGIFFNHIAYALALFLLLPTGRLQARMRIAALAGGALLVMVPVNGLSLAEYGRSLTNDLSISTLFWLAWCAWARIGGIMGMSERRHLQLALCFGSLALLLYPAALGLSMFDPYRLGYAPRYLILFVGTVSFALWLVRHYFGAALLTAVTAVFMLDFRSPANYWDYLIDPLLGLYCLSVVGWHILLRILRNVKGRFEWPLAPGMTRPAFENSSKRLISSVTNLCSEDGIKNTE